MIKIGFDILGGDFAPHGPLNAALKFAKDKKNVQLVLYGLEDTFKNVELPQNVETVICSQKINSDEEPASAIRSKKDSTMIRGVKDQKEGITDVFISSGNTGALIAAGVFVTRRIKGIDRPALPGFLPSSKKETPTIFLDLGANIETKPTHLEQYALLSQGYAKAVFGIPKPTVALLNIGEEETKGTELYVETYKLLRDNPTINFIGNVEPRELIQTEIDIIVTDGFTGNIVLKTLEGNASFFKELLTKLFNKNPINMFSGVIVLKDLNKFKKQMDYKEVGATPIFGVDGMVLKAHGSSDEKALYNALNKAIITVKSDYIKKVKEEFYD